MSVFGHTLTLSEPEPSATTFATAEQLANPNSITFGNPTVVDLNVYQGDSGRFKVTVKDALGAAIDVSGAQWDCDIRQNSSASPPMAVLTVTPVAGDVSSVTVILTGAESRKLITSGVWDLEMTLAGEVITLVRGTVNVTPDISRTP